MSGYGNFHFIFGLKPQTRPFHLMHYLCLRSCLEINRPAAMHFHYRNLPWGPLWDQIAPELTLRTLDPDLPLAGYAYPAANASATYRYAHAADFLRVAILRREGGVYADMDTLFVRPYPTHLLQAPCVMGHERVDRTVAAAAAGGSLCNAVIFAQAESRFLSLWQQRMAATFDGSWSRHSTFLPFELSQQFPETIRIEPESSFFYLDWTRDGVARLFETAEVLPETVYSLHLWAHLWWDRDRVDVSSFHGDRLTPEYVAFADTTYARYARPFLPPTCTLRDRVAWQRQAKLETALEPARRWIGRLRSLSGKR